MRHDRGECRAMCSKRSSHMVHADGMYATIIAVKATAAAVRDFSRMRGLRANFTPALITHNSTVDMGQSALSRV